MKSQELKAAMLSHMLYRLHHIGAVTEYGGKGVHGIADCFGITEAGLTYEFEVKCSRADLMGELNAIEYILSEKTLFKSEERPKTFSKGLKHKVYLKPESISYTWIKENAPNYFSFVVPEKLRAIANEKLKNTPYGLYIVFWHENGNYPYFEVSCDKRGKRLHDAKVTNEQIFNILRKNSVEVQCLRSNGAKDATPITSNENESDE